MQEIAQEYFLFTKQKLSHVNHAVKSLKPLTNNSVLTETVGCILWVRAMLSA